VKAFGGLGAKKCPETLHSARTEAEPDRRVLAGQL